MDSINAWLETTYKNHVSKKGEITPSELNHILDWMKSKDAERYLTRLNRISVPQALDMANKWTVALNKKAEKELKHKIDLGGIEVVYKFKDGYSIVKLVSDDSFKREGMEMGHCVASYLDLGREFEILSLRDEKNEPHATIEYIPSKRYVQQIKGKQNDYVVPKYHAHIVEFLNDFKFDSYYSHDLANINATFLGNYIFLNEKMPKVVTIPKDLYVDDFDWRLTFKELVVKGDLTMKLSDRCLKLAENLVVEGDLVIHNFNVLVKLCDNLVVKGSIEIENCGNLKTLANTVSANYLSIYDCPKFSQKIKGIELEVG